MTHVVQLRAGDYELDVEPEEGGAVSRFTWRGEPLFRARTGPGPLNSACFPMTPFSNRIAFGRFEVDGRQYQLAPNLPGSDHPHTLHGFAWQKAWSVTALTDASAVMSYNHEPDAWPWQHRAEQRFELSEAGFRHVLSVRNESKEFMPAGLGLHPYFPRTGQTTYRGLHDGEWETSAAGLPIKLRMKSEPWDWWEGAPVGAREVDTVYTGRSGRLQITWPERNLRLTIEPDEAVNFTVVYAPPRRDFFCVEPVSHETDAVNRQWTQTGLRWLAPGMEFAISVDYVAQRTDTRSAAQGL